MKKILINSLAKSGTNYVIEILKDVGYIEGVAGVSYQSVLARPYFIRKIIRGGVFERAPIVVGLDIKVTIGERWLTKRLSKLHRGQFTSSHFSYSDRLFALLSSMDISTIQIIRNPLAVALSYKEYLEKSRMHLCHNDFMVMSENERWDLVVNGGKIGDYYVESLRQRLLAVDEWRRHPGEVFLIKYEELVAAREGGGSSVVERMAGFVQCDAVKVLQAISNVYGQSKTFNRGEDDLYQDRIPVSHIRLINKQVGDIADNWGYS